MIDAITAFVLLGAILFIGFIAALVFERTGVPDTLLLVFLGLLLGPFMHVVDVGPVNGLVQFFSALALIVILFSNGLQLNVYKVTFHLKKAAVFSLFSYALASLAVAAVSFVALGLDPLKSLFLGVVFGGTCSTVTSVIMPKIRTEEENRAMLTLESTITEALSIVFAITLIQMMLSNSVDFSSTLNAIASAFSVAIVVGGVVGIAWLGVLRDLRVKPFGNLLTLAAAFVLYGAVELAKGNGAIAALVFGLVLGNAPEISSLLRLQGQFEIDKTIKQFQGELAFFVRTFFFVYIGMNFSAAVEWQVPAFALLAVAAILASRLVATELLVKPRNGKTRMFYALVAPRGLAVAVLAALPLAKGVEFPHIFEIALLVIIITNLLAAVGVFSAGLREGQKPREPERKEQKEEKAPQATRKRPQVVKIS